MQVPAQSNNKDNKTTSIVAILVNLFVTFY